MRLPIVLDQTKLMLHVARDVLKRLSATSFGPLGGQPFAGKFISWPTLQAAFADPVFLIPLLERVQAEFDRIEDGRSAKVRFTLKLDRMIGWDTTLPLGEFSADELVEFKPNDWTTGLAVKPQAGWLAPFTDLVTFSGRLLKGDQGRVIDLFALYPGFDIGRLTPSFNLDEQPDARAEAKQAEVVIDITPRIQRAFFAFDHPGEPLAA